jgi:hypothetical protein
MSRPAKIARTAERATKGQRQEARKATKVVETLALMLTCPRCGVGPNSPCLTNTGGVSKVTHYQRRRVPLRAYRAGQMDRDNVVIRFPGRYP